MNGFLRLHATRRFSEKNSGVTVEKKILTQ